MSAKKAFAGLDRINFSGLRLRLIDAENQVVGRLAAQVSKILQGKDKPTYTPSRDLGDVCVVINAEKAVLTGRKWDDKVYRHHTGTPGGLKEITAKEVWRRNPTKVLYSAVSGMIPKNNLRRDRMMKLRIFPGSEHPFTGVELVPWEPPPRVCKDNRMGWSLPEGFEPMNSEAYSRRLRGSRRHKMDQRGQSVSFDDMLAPEERQVFKQEAEEEQKKVGS